MRDLDAILEAAGFEEEVNGEEISLVESLTKDEKAAAKLLVKNMEIDFNSRNFENPSLQQFFSGL
jgi:hypothetical protein